MHSPENPPIAHAKWALKACDICGGNALEELGRRRIVQRNRYSAFEFVLHDTLCVSCGFVFAGQVPDGDFLRRYYADAFTPDSKAERPIEPDFNAEIRLQAIREHLPDGADVLEIGSNTGEFVEYLAKAGYRAHGIDPVATASDGTEVDFLDGQNPIAPNSFDAVASYYVLEHITHPRDWILSWLPALRAGGKLIIEVPNFYTHPRESLVHEHLLHFSPSHLAAMLADLGFSINEAERREASRPFGFCLVATKGAAEPMSGFLEPNLPEKSRGAYREAMAMNRREDAAYGALGKELRARFGIDAKFICWGANRYAARMLRELEAIGAKEVAVVDNSQQKIGLKVEGMPVAVSKPEFQKRTSGKRVFLLCSPSHNPVIDAQVRGLRLVDAEIVDTISWINRYDREQTSVAHADLIPQRK